VIMFEDVPQPETDLQAWAAATKIAVEQFVQFWLANQAKVPQHFPNGLPTPEWDEQFYSWLSSRGNPDAD
ncbi:hypothetical protein ABK046_48650, partial [Streptomyces caeruleatus]